MKVLCIEKPGKLELKEFPKPQLQPGQAVIKMEMCGICGSDVTAYRGVNPTMKYPINGLGHEGVGVVVEVGENPEGLKVGDRVALEPYVPCLKCHMCAEERWNNCVDLHVCGVHKDGMMAEYFLHPTRQCFKIPDDMSFIHAALVEPFTIGLHGATRARAKKGEHVVVFGAGVIGLMASFACINYGATPILVDLIQERLDEAKAMGVPYTFNSGKGDVEEYLKEVTGGKLPEAMIDCTGAPAILGKMHDYVCHGGRIALIGWPHDPVMINTVRLMQKEIDVLPSRNSNKKFPEAIRLIHEGKLPVDALTTKTCKLEEVETVIQDMIKNPADYLKVVVEI